MDSVGRAALEGAALGALAGGVGAAVGAAGLSGAAAFAVSEGADFIGGFLYDIGVNGLSREQALINGLAGIGFGGAIGLLGRGISRAARNINLPNNLRRQCASFSADTLIATPDGDKPISEIEVGDVILAYSEATEEVDLYHVSATYTQHHETTLDVAIDGETLHTTDEHPFYVIRDDQEQWVQAKHLHIGDSVLSTLGETGIVEDIVIVDQPQTMYNLTVALVATYMVGDGQWLVHNQDFPFDIIGATLFLGEGDFGFSSSIAGLVSPEQAQLIVATDYWTERVPGSSRFYEFLDNVQYLNSLGAEVMTDVDATNLRGVFPNQAFDTIIWNFPHTGGRPESNIPILQQFYRSANDVVSPEGRVYTILSAANPYNKVGAPKYAAPWFKRINMQVIRPFSEYEDMFPRYSHVPTRQSARVPTLPGARIHTFCRA